MTQSEVARIRRQIAAEHMAAQLGLQGLWCWNPQPLPSLPEQVILRPIFFVSQQHAHISYHDAQIEI